MVHVTRRHGLGLGVAAFVCLPAGPVLAEAADAIGGIERRHGGRLGVFALDTGTGHALAHRADERFLMQSTFKGILAAMVLARVDAGRDALDNAVSTRDIVLLPHSPVTGAHAAAGAISVGTLCQAILAESDNTAANLLLARVGGPAMLTAFVRSLGDGVTRVDWYELIDGWKGIEDTTTPRAIAGLARRMVLGDALQPGSRALLQHWMENTAPGRTRLRAAFPAGWRACDRTGSGDGICNDYAVAWPPGRAPLVMAAYYDARGMEMAPQEAVLREIGAAVVKWAG